ncbi:sulfur oxidation c-type cytochrome SoxX [Loktanella sp. M215]|uniref:sulfur oxidation c-type cytochrome SoxX n=1 Tax=Loktanella sp. M215 TaxID=2675431 RepID=UPI001F007BD8|nr:sulfur oxidation c-type cytochrome SoxX [Loktanella sp. M215]MCF7698916.1 sulfur oxidation c-type cytochrome SoxX [Loktanella sp. M215]
MIRTITAIAGLCLATAAAAQEVAPADVSFDDAGAIAVSLSGQPGDGTAGQEVMTTRSMGNCVACHQVSALDAAFQGNVGPSLDGVADRWDETQLRGIVANAKMMFPDTMMPAFYKVSGYTRPGDAFTGKAGTEPLPPLLSAQQIEDVVAYLTTLKE